MLNPLLETNYVAEGAITKYRFVKYGTAKGAVAQASAGTDKIVGSTRLIDIADGERVDVSKVGINEVEYGAIITKGTSITADANGKAVAAVSGDTIAGQAEVDGVSGDIGSYTISISEKP